MSDANTAYGYNDGSDNNGDYNSVNAIVEQILSQRHTATLVRITAVRPGNGPVGRVDMQPLVHQVDGQGGFMAHGTIYDAPYFRYQGGNSAIILDPKVGNNGIAIIADRDISSIKETQAAALPETRRSMSLSDGMYLGGLLNSQPTQYIRLDDDDGISMVTTVKVTIQAPQLIITGDSIKHNGKEIGSPHTHPVSAAPGTTGTPT